MFSTFDKCFVSSRWPSSEVNNMEYDLAKIKLAAKAYIKTIYDEWLIIQLDTPYLFIMDACIYR